MASPRDLLVQAKAQIKESVPADVEPLLGQVTLLDVREPDENEQGAIPGSIHLPRGRLEFQVEGKIPDKDVADNRLLRRWRPLGIRRPRRCRSSDTKTWSRWSAGSTAGRTKADPGPCPRPSRQSSGTATSATSCSPRSATPDSSSFSTRRFSCSAQAGSARPPLSIWRPQVSGRSGSSTWTSSTPRTFNARSSTTSIESASARSTRPRRRSPR